LSGARGGFPFDALPAVGCSGQALTAAFAAVRNDIKSKTKYGGLVNFLNQLLRGIAFIPALVNGIETLFHSKTGTEKKDAAMTFLENALATVDAVTAREIVDPEKFKHGMSVIIDGVVECFNASAWAKSGGQVTAPSPQA
jgi:hypothetical protein